MTNKKNRPIEIDLTDKDELRKLVESDCKTPINGTPFNMLNINTMLDQIKNNPELMKEHGIDEEWIKAFERIFKVSDIGERKRMVDIMMQEHLKKSMDYKDSTDSKTLMGGLVFMKAILYMVFEIPFDELAEEMGEMFPNRK